MLGVGAGLTVIGGLGLAINNNCNFFCGDGTLSIGLMIAGGSVAVIGLSLTIAGVVMRNSPQPQTVRFTPILGPRTAGLGFATRF